VISAQVRHTTTQSGRVCRKTHLGRGRGSSLSLVLTRVYAISFSVDSRLQAIDRGGKLDYNRGMENTTKTIDLRVIDTFTLSQEDAMDLPLSERLSYALHQTTLQLQRQYSCSYNSALSIAQDSLTEMKVAYV